MFPDIFYYNQYVYPPWAIRRFQIHKMNVGNYEECALAFNKGINIQDGEEGGYASKDSNNSGPTDMLFS